MSYRDREIETKLVVNGITLDAVADILRGLFHSVTTRMVYGSSMDTYWALTGDQKADFIRMRRLDNGITQITVKGQDRGNALNRMEIDVDTTTDAGKVQKLLTAAHGKATGNIKKTYYVYWLGLDEHTTISCYRVDQPEYPGVIIEAEATNETRMLELEFKILEHFAVIGIKCERAPGSLFNMFIEKERSDAS
jgi:adenylate cyclase class IV